MCSLLLGNGIIEFPEFVDLMSRRPWGHLGTPDELREAMSGAFDHNKDGHLEVKQPPSCYSELFSLTESVYTNGVIYSHIIMCDIPRA